MGIQFPPIAFLYLLYLFIYVFFFFIYLFIIIFYIIHIFVQWYKALLNLNLNLTGVPLYCMPDLVTYINSTLSTIDLMK